jgi:hypothetical protein
LDLWYLLKQLFKMEVKESEEESCKKFSPVCQGYSKDECVRTLLWNLVLMLLQILVKQVNWQTTTKWCTVFLTECLVANLTPCTQIMQQCGLTTPSLLVCNFSVLERCPNQRHLNFDCFSSFKTSIHPYRSKLIFLV